MHKMRRKRRGMARPKLYKNRARLTLNLEKSVLREFDRLAFALQIPLAGPQPVGAAGHGGEMNTLDRWMGLLVALACDWIEGRVA